MEWEKFEIGIWIYLQRFRQGSRINGNPAGFRQKCVDCPAADDPEECLLFNEGRVELIALSAITCPANFARPVKKNFPHFSM